MNNNVYRIDWDKLVKLFLPISLRQPLLIWLFWSCVNPVKSIHSLFLNFRKDRLKRVSYNSQVVYLQKMLNDEFDPFLKRIKVQNNSIDDRRLLYYQQRQKPLYLGKSYLFGEKWIRNYDFLVLIPEDVKLDKTQLITMKNLIEYYKLYSKNYEIRYESR